jgi:hypothetical protein
MVMPRGGSPGARAFWAAALCLVAGCGSGGSSKTGGGLSGRDADFSVCAMTPAVDFVPGVAVASVSGAYTATLQAASTTDGRGGAPVALAGIGYDTFTIAVTPGGDAGNPGSTDALAMTIPPVPTDVPADPYMPQHGHGGSTIPTITPQGGGVFAVSNIDFFMAGYWQLFLDLQPAAGATKDRVTFLICIPNE